MQENGIPVPHHICVDRDNLPPGTDPPGFVETEDYVEQNGDRLFKPHPTSMQPAYRTIMLLLHVGIP
jgi:hypothetical protein